MKASWWVVVPVVLHRCGACIKHGGERIDRSARRRRADVAAEDLGSDGRGCGCGDGAREASESAARASGGTGRRAQRCRATRHGRECERSASVARAPSRALLQIAVVRTARQGARQLFEDSPSFLTTRTCAVSNGTGAEAATAPSSADIGSNDGYSR